MPLSDLVEPRAVIASLKVNSKDQALQALAKRAAVICGGSERGILDVLAQRERLGSTGVGQGIAIPHGKLAGIDRFYGMFARLEKPIDFESLDGEPVDLVFVLLAPDTAGANHLKALAQIARLLRDGDVTRKLRETRDAAAIYGVLTQPHQDTA